MAKRKRRRSKKQKFEISIGLYAVLFILVAVLGIGKFGPAGRMLASFSLFLTGSAYMITLFVLLILGIYTLFKGEWPEFFSTKMLGLYLFVIGVLTVMHWQFVSLNNGDVNVIFKETLNQLNLGFQNIMATGSVGDNVSVGGGLIGGVFAISFAKLFSYLGMQIVTIVLIVGGIVLFTGFSIVDFKE